MDYYINIYILLYKLKNGSERWIVKYSENYKELKNIIRYIDNDEKSIGNYYIVKRIEKESIVYEKLKQFKQFQIYKCEYHDELLCSI